MFWGTGQEACISQMLAKKQNTLREREPRFQELSLQGLWKSSGHGLAKTQCWERCPRANRSAILPYVSWSMGEVQRQKRKEILTLFPAPCCCALRYYLHIVKLSTHWYSLCKKKKNIYIYIYPLFWTIQSCISWAWGKLGDKPSRSFSWIPQWWSMGWQGASRLSQTYSGTLAFSDQEPSENGKTGLITKISEGHLSITIPNKKNSPVFY